VVAGTWAYGIDERGLKISVWQWHVDDFGKFLGLLLLGRCALLHPSVAYRREKIVEIGGYGVSYRLAADYALWINLVLAKHRAALIPQRLVMFRSHQQRQSLLQAHKHQQDTAFAHEKLVRALSVGNDISLLSSVLRIESTIWNRGLTREQIGQTLEAVNVLYENAAPVFSLDADELKAMSRTVSRWLGPGVSLAAKNEQVPDVIFYAILFALSPLLVPGVRPLATRIVESWRMLRMLPERVIH